MMSTSKELFGEFEATHSLEEIKQMARERGISPTGSKREIIALLLAEPVPQTIPGDDLLQYYKVPPSAF